MLYSGLLTLFSSYPRTRRQKDCRSLSSSTLSWFTWVCAGYFLFSLWVRISLPTGAASPPETVRCSLLFSVFAHLAIKRFKSICPPHLCPLFSVRRHIIYWPQLWTQQRRMRCAEPWCNKAFFWVVIRRRLRLPAAFIPRSRQLVERFDRLHTSPSVATSPPDQDGTSNHHAEPRLNPPAPYSGEPNTCRSFLSQCSLIFSLQPSCFPTERSKVAFIITLLVGQARVWGTAMWDNEQDCCSSFDSFSEELRKVFDRSAQGTEAARALALLRQRESSVSSYSIEFRTLAESCGWNDKALWDHFLHGLAEHIKDEIYSLELPSSLDGLIDLAIRVDNRISLRSRHRRSGFPPELVTRAASGAASDTPTQHLGLSEEEPMQVGRARLTVKERRYRLDNQLCLYCGEAGHVAASCPAVRRYSPFKGERTVSVTGTQLPSGGRCEFQASLLFKGTIYQVGALIDSGAEGDFMDSGLARRLGLPSVALVDPILARTLCGTLLTKITHATKFVTLTLSGNHAEEIRFLLIHSPTAPVVLGHTWLAKHNPHIDWALNLVLGWSSFCLAQCLGAAFSPVMSCSVLQEELVSLAGVPEAYHDLGAVFSKSQASSLPPHRPYDCAIDLLPGTSPPKGRLYSLSRPEREAMERYIHDSQVAGIIRPSSSPAGAGFFFVGKKDGSLRPCIDYRGLNDITVKNRYPLTLMSSAFELLQGAAIFTKLDLRNAYHLVRIREGDEWKTAFNTPTGHFEYLVMPFGLSNSPAVFQALVNDVLRDMVDRFVFDFVLTISWSSPRTSAIMSSTSGECSNGYLRIVYLPRWRSASFTHGRFRSWDLFSLPRVSVWTPPR